ncbi:MAG: RagB/SusD family nutrient uptake outer membrane protein [Tannerella sp.]|nr:RagB/SusD family nutrient uptake outer membrane protein [Tannerella sp.]
MKNLRILSIVMILALSSCNESKWLNEEVYSFYSPENSYVTPEHFNSAIARIYAEVANVNVCTNDNTAILKGGFADNLYHFYSPEGTVCNYVKNCIPESGIMSFFWTNYYKIVFDANVIISRIDDEGITFPSDKQRASLKAEASFFRAWAYKNLAILFGGVPLILEEIDEPRRDFIRTSRDDVYNQCVTDLQFAVDNLPDVAELTEDGRLTKAAASHILSEVYLCMKDWDRAISAASAVINNPAYALMTQRFGTWKDRPGDVFRDLFIRDNQNRNCTGGPNTEAIWVNQYEYNVPGGGVTESGPRFFGVWYWSLQDKNGVPLFISFTNQNGGRAFGFYANNDYINYDIWEDDWNDMRNSEYNIRRDMVADNPESEYYGKKIVESDAILDPGPYNEFWRPFWAKFVPFDNFPTETIQDPATGVTYTSAMAAFTDSYFIRLAETYLLRAEAYLGKGNLESAAADINVVRRRANATPVSAGEVNLDYILDERSRELEYEEMRVLTLMRCEKLIERVKKYNPFFNGKYSSHDIYDYHQLWPVPQSEIERNTDAVLEQNPGYN